MGCGNYCRNYKEYYTNAFNKTGGVSMPDTLTTDMCYMYNAMRVCSIQGFFLNYLLKIMP